MADQSHFCAGSRMEPAQKTCKLTTLAADSPNPKPSPKGGRWPVRGRTVGCFAAEPAGKTCRHVSLALDMLRRASEMRSSQFRRSLADFGSFREYTCILR